MVTWLPCDDYPLIRTRKKVMGFPHCLTRMGVSLNFSKFKRSPYRTPEEIYSIALLFWGPLIVSKPPLVAAKIFDVLTLSEVMIMILFGRPATWAWRHRSSVCPSPPYLGKYLDYDQYFMIAVVSHIAKAPHYDETCSFFPFFSKRPLTVVCWEREKWEQFR